jgi:hypothetical protein
MAKFLALPFGGWDIGSLGNVDAFWVRPRCVQAPDKKSMHEKSVKARAMNPLAIVSHNGSAEWLRLIAPMGSGHCLQNTGKCLIQRIEVART